MADPASAPAAAAAATPGVADFPAVVVAIIVGATALVLVYVSSLLRKSRTIPTDTPKSADSEASSSPPTSTSRKDKAEKAVRKKHNDKRETKQPFKHMWLMTTLKGHTGQVLDMDFSSDGNFLVTCGDEDMEDLNRGEASEHSSSCSEGNKENSPEIKTAGNGKGGLLSRRQKKNRIRRDDNFPVQKNCKNVTKKSRNKTKHAVSINSRQLHAVSPTLGQYIKLNIPGNKLCVLLRHYVLSPEQLKLLGFPTESALCPGKAVIYKNFFAVYKQMVHNLQRHRPSFDVNAEEFVPKKVKEQNGTCIYKQDAILNSQDLNINLHMSKVAEQNGLRLDHAEIHSQYNVDNGLKIEIGAGRRTTSNKSSTCLRMVNGKQKHTFPKNDCCDIVEKECVRCGRGFFVTNGKYVTWEQCSYHWGRLQRVMVRNTNSDAPSNCMEFSCCRGREDSHGCTTARLHVWNGVCDGPNGPLDGFVQTRERDGYAPDGNLGVFALDCEMCFTACGLELTKVTVVSVDGQVVYDSFVKPENDIIDYNTRFSGITAADLSEKGSTKLLKEVQKDLMEFIKADTILVGHGLENDLRALRIIHGTVIDTSIIFPHYYGLPYRRSLKSLANSFLECTIQQSSSGHNSFEDARTCMELVLWRVRKDLEEIVNIT